MREGRQSVYKVYTKCNLSVAAQVSKKWIYEQKKDMKTV